MKIKDRIVLVLKGMCMGFADIVPGVSGGTLALVLGIYARLINAIRAIDHRLVQPLWKAVRGGLRREARADLVAALRAADLPWLVTLFVGILSAIVIGSRVIPSLMERYPQVMFAFFFGLVLASVVAPLKLIERFGAKEVAGVVIFALVGFFSVGDQMTPPLVYNTIVVEDGGQTLKALAEAGPSANPPEQIYWDPQNEALRAAVPLDEQLRGLDPKDARNPYNDLKVPAGVEVHVPAVTLWWILIAGFIGICAMILPGISGSFILLVLGSYYFILNALKGFIRALTRLDFPETQAAYVLLFCVGCLAGLMIMTRVLGWLLERAPGPTMAALIGLMLGSLRAIWPFKERVADSAVMQNVAPSLETFGNTVWFAAAAFVVGVALVIGLATVAGRLEARQEREAA